MAGGRRRRAVAALVLLAITRVALRAHSDGLASYLRSPFDSAAHLSVKEQRPYDETCGHLRAPYNVSALTGSAQMSSQSGALSAVRQALTSGNLDNRKVVLVGDSVIYQIFAALVCLSRSAGGPRRGVRAVGNGHRRVADLVQRVGRTAPHVQRQEAGDHGEEPRRLPLPPRRGGPARPRLAQKLRGPRAMKFEGITLTGGDTVFTHATVHLAGRWLNMEKIMRLLTCMDHARNNGEDPGWPTIRVVGTLPQHFPEPGGEYSDAARVDRNGCLVSIRPEESEFYQQETLHFVQNGIALVGRDLGLEDLGMYHVGRTNPDVKLDCTHWSMPGVPDLVAKEIMEIAADL